MWPFFALEHRLHDLDAVGGKDGGIAFLDGQGRTPSFQLLADGRRRRGIFAVDADVRDLKAERGASRLLAERGDLFKIAPPRCPPSADPTAANGMDERRGNGTRRCSGR